MADDPWAAFPVVQSAQQSDAIPTMTIKPEGGDPWAAFPKAQQAQPSMAKDIASGGNRGLIEGFGSLLGMPADVVHLIDKGSMAALTYGMEKMGRITPETGQAVRDRVGYPPELDEQLRSDAINKHLLRGANALGINTDQPQTTPGQYAETIGSFVPGALSMGEASVPGMLKAAGKYAAIPGATSETAGQATKGTAAEPYARAAGAIAPAAIGMGVSLATRRMTPMAKSMRGASDQQWQDAQQLVDDSRDASGTPRITTTEAIQKITGGATRAGDLQRVTEQSPAGGAIMKPFMAQRPAQTEALGRSAMREIAPQPGLPYEIPERVQGAASGVLSDADKARSAATKPLYQAAAADDVPVAEMNNFLGKIDTMIAQDKTGLVSPQLQSFRNSLIDRTTGEPITDIQNLDTARKYFRDQIAQPAIAQDAIPKQIGARMQGLVSDLRDMMTQASPNFAGAKQLHQDISQNVVNPLQRSPTGQLADTSAFEKQAQILFNANPLPGSERAIALAVRQIAAKDPVAAQQMTRMYLEKLFNEATQNNMTGPNQFGGAKFAAVAMGNSQQARNAQAAITALPNGQMRWAAFNKAIDIFKAMGERHPAGSLTSFNQQLQKGLEGLGAMKDAAAAVASPGKWLGMASDIYKKYAFEKNTAALAQAMVSGDVKDLRRVVGGSPNSVLPQAALIALLVKEGTQAGQPQQ